MITVLVPTADRADLLEVSLRAISRQTARSRIESVVVSENLGNRASEAVCQMFPELPITYLLQNPQLPVMEHVRRLMEAVDTEYTAFVCDDDLWSPGHLQNAVDALECHPGASAHCSACVQASSELSPHTGILGAALLWLAAGTPPRFSSYVFNRDAVLALCWIDTPFSWSTLVAPTRTLRAAARALTDSPHAFYADRMLFPALAALGDIVYDPAVDTLYRLYTGNWQSSQDHEHLGELIQGAWDLIEGQAAERGVDLAALWRGYLAAMPDAVREDVVIQMQQRFANDVLLRHGLDEWIPLVPEPEPPPPPVPRPPKWRRVGGHFKRGFLELAGRLDEDRHASLD